jgi:hypothetical protein
MKTNIKIPINGISWDKNAMNYYLTLVSISFIHSVINNIVESVNKNTAIIDFHLFNENKIK